MAMVNRRTGQPQGCTASTCFDLGCLGCGDGLGLHIPGGSLTRFEIGGLFPRLVEFRPGIERHAFDAQGEPFKVTRDLYEQARRFGFRVLYREYRAWGGRLLWVWDGRQLVIHSDTIPCPPGAVRALEAA